mgnify:CR=1 FL=1
MYQSIKAHLKKCAFIAKLLSFEDFSEYVDEALVEMRKLLSTNKAIAAIVGAKDKGGE